ncbi:MAG: TetR/AcrR family transcriptional regulator [Eubacteriales bacterium]|nr:TetR/AcrR family transcriptional regulator [Eubacteriales bacterium]
MKERTSTKAEYRSAIRSRRMIREAYMELLKEKDLSKITVTDIIKRADLNRATFYAHYPDVRGVTEEIENEIIEKMLEVLKEFQFTSFFRNPAPLLLKISRYLEEDTDFYRILVRANGSEIFMEKLKKVFSDHMLNDSDIPESMRQSKMVELRVCYFAGGIVNLYKQWFRGDLNCTLNDIALEVSKLLQLEAKEIFG